MRPRTLALLSCLIVLVVALGAISLGFSSSLQGVLPPRQAVSPTTVQLGGNLLVRVLYASGSPVPAATVALRNLASRLPFSIPYQTNSNGELLLPEPPGQYSVAVSNDQFQTSATLKVTDGNTTEMDVSVNQTARASVFNEVRDTGLSGFAPPWEQVVVAVPANAVLYHPGDTVFIQRSGFPVFFVSFVAQVNGSMIVIWHGINGINGTNALETKAHVVSSDLRSGNQTSLLWLTLKIDNFLPLDLLQGLQLVTYSATTQVSIRAG